MKHQEIFMPEIIQKNRTDIKGNRSALVSIKSRSNFLWKSTRYRQNVIRIVSIRGSVPSLRGVRRDATTSFGAAVCDGWRRRGAGALPSQSPGHRSSPAALAGCRCLARRALREVPKCLRASYTRATIDRTPSPNFEILRKTFLFFTSSRSASFLFNKFHGSFLEIFFRKRREKKIKRIHRQTGNKKRGRNEKFRSARFSSLPSGWKKRV